MKTQISLENKTIHLIGTAHVSNASVKEVLENLTEIIPDAIAIELDPERYQSMTDQKKWENTDIVKIIKEKKVSYLFAQMILSSYQRKIANQFKLNAGEEMKVAIEFAQEHNIQLHTIDRNIQITLLRIIDSLGFIEKIKLMTELVLSMFEKDIQETDIEKLKESDLLQAALAQVALQYPQITDKLIDERDRIMAQKLRTAKGTNIVAVVGAAHVPGILKYIHHSNNIQALLQKPKPKKSSKLLQWILPLSLVGLMVISITQTSTTAFDTILRFILVNGSLAALGTALALGHPLSILTAFVMAPIGILSPFLATGWFAGLTEAYVHKPKVEDFLALQDDILTLKGYWKNRVARILLVVIFANLFTSFGTFIYSFDLIKNLFN